MSLSSAPALLADLRALASTVAEGAYVPYSGRKTAAMLLLSDGRWIPGVRVECASYSLTIPAVLTAFATAVSAGRTDAVALVLSRPGNSAEQVFLRHVYSGPFDPVAPDAYVRKTATFPSSLCGRLDPFLPVPPLSDAHAGVLLARDVARRAYVPESNFPVGCVAVTRHGYALPGVNVEMRDWAWILCAERSALGTAVSYGVTDLGAFYLTCLPDPGCAPCGACRQLLVELAPNSVLWMDQGDLPPASERMERLLPGSFSGVSLRRHPRPG